LEKEALATDKWKNPLEGQATPLRLLAKTAGALIVWSSLINIRYFEDILQFVYIDS
jgi:hypothetical protein